MCSETTEKRHEKKKVAVRNNKCPWAMRDLKMTFKVCDSILLNAVII